MSNIRKYGWKPDSPDQRDQRMKAVTLVAFDTLPPKIDLRSTMPPVFDQGDLGSCTANATAAQVWAIDKTAPVQPSRLFIYYNTRILEGTVGQDSGASIRNSIRSVVRYGFASEELCPYDVSKFKKKPSVAAYKSALTEKVSQYLRVTQSAVGIKGALSLGYTVNFGFTVYQSFESNEVARTGMMPIPEKREAVLGGHAVLIVGYDDSIGRYIVRNSWGSSWGDNGYFYMPYGYAHNSNLADDFWVIKAVP